MAHVAVVDRVGTGVLSLFEFVGAIATFGGRAIVEGVRPPYEPREILRHLFQFGYRSAPLILTAGFAIGIVLSMHTRASLERFGAEAMIPAGLAIALIRAAGHARRAVPAIADAGVDGARPPHRQVPSRSAGDRRDAAQRRLDRQPRDVAVGGCGPRGHPPEGRASARNQSHDDTCAHEWRRTTRQWERPVMRCHTRETCTGTPEA